VAASREACSERLPKGTTGAGCAAVVLPKPAELTCPLNSRAMHGFIVALSDQARRSDPSPGLAGLSSAAKAPLWGAFALFLRGQSFRARPTSPSARLALSGSRAVPSLSCGPEPPFRGNGPPGPTVLRASSYAETDPSKDTNAGWLSRRLGSSGGHPGEREKHQPATHRFARCLDFHAKCGNPDSLSGLID
jgi:hypothetical protein